MPASSDPPVELRAYAAPDELPDAARALLGATAYDTPGWYAATLQGALPAGAVPCFQVASRDKAVLAVLPMLLRDGHLAALTSPYTALWQPLLAPGVTAEDAARIGRALAAGWAGSGVVRLECLPAEWPLLPALLGGLRRGGLVPLTFDHFGTWRCDVANAGWDAYLAARPGALRTTVRRQTRRLTGAGQGRFTLTTGGPALQAAIADYEAVYAASWKQPEPYPDFAATLMRAAAAEGSLRLGVLHVAEAPVAAQLWLVHRGWAGVLKLAHDEAHRATAPGTVLTGLVIRHLLDEEHVTALDFGRGDDAYKASWTGSRLQRVGVLVVNPLSVVGGREVGRHLLGKAKASTGQFGRWASKAVRTLSQA